MTETQTPKQGFRYQSNLPFLLILMVIIGLFYWLWPGDRRDDVYVEVETPDFVFIEPDDLAIPVEVSLSLVNTTDEAIQLHAQNDCYIFRWQLLDEDNRMVQTHIVEGCGNEALTQVLEPNSTLVNQTTLLFSPARVPPRHRYTLIVRYWGYEGESIIRTRVGDGDN